MTGRSSEEVGGELHLLYCLCTKYKTKQPPSPASPSRTTLSHSLSPPRPVRVCVHFVRMKCRAHARRMPKSLLSTAPAMVVGEFCLNRCETQRSINTGTSDANDECLAACWLHRVLVGVQREQWCACYAARRACTPPERQDHVAQNPVSSRGNMKSMSCDMVVQFF